MSKTIEKELTLAERIKKELEETGKYSYNYNENNGEYDGTFVRWDDEKGEYELSGVGDIDFEWLDHKENVEDVAEYAAWAIETNEDAIEKQQALDKLRDLYQDKWELSQVSVEWDNSRESNCYRLWDETYDDIGSLADFLGIMADPKGFADQVIEEAADNHGKTVASRLEDSDEWTVVDRGAVEAAYRKAYLDHMDDTGDLVDDLVQNGDGGMSAYEYARMNPGLYEGDLPDETWDGMLKDMEEKGWIKRNVEKED